MIDRQSIHTLPAELVSLMVNRYRLCVDLEMLLKALEGYEVVVEGECELLSKLLERRERTLKIVESMCGEENGEQEPALASEIETLTSDPEWEVAEDICQDLLRRSQRYEKKISDYRIKLLEWGPRIDKRRLVLNAAREARAPVREEREEFVDVRGWVEQAERALNDHQYILLHNYMMLLSNKVSEFEEHTKAVRQKIDRSSKFARQADLLLLQSPLDARKRYHYAVLLRTPSEPGSHGINIQGSTTMVSQDHELMSDIVKRITGNIQGRDARQVIPSTATTAGDARAASTELQKPEIQGQMTRRYLFGKELGQQAESIPLGAMIREMGELMYRLFMPDQMQRYLVENKSSLTITTNDLELPWELMSYRANDGDKDETSFLCLSRPVARMPMGQAFPNVQTQSPRTHDKRHFLLIRPSTDDLPFAKQEIATIKQELKDAWKDQIQIDTLEEADATGRELNDVLRSAKYDVIHFSGHAYYDKADSDLSGLVLHDGEVFFAQKIRRLLKGRPLVFLNACESALTANEEAQRNGDRQIYRLQNPAEGLASALIYGGALGCIGSLWPIYDQHAAEFAISFYKYVLKGDMIGEAMRRARCQIKAEFSNYITWAAFVLYGDPTFTLDDWSTY